jgi:hypothetical protein
MLHSPQIASSSKTKIKITPEIVELLCEESLLCIEDDLLVGSGDADVLGGPGHGVRRVRVDHNLACGGTT